MVQRATIGKRWSASRHGEGIPEKERERAIRGIRGELVRQKERGRSTAGSNASAVGEVVVLGVFVRTSHERSRQCDAKRVPVCIVVWDRCCAFYFINFSPSFSVGLRISPLIVDRKRERKRENDGTLPCDTRVILWVVSVVRQDAV